MTRSGSSGFDLPATDALHGEESASWFLSGALSILGLGSSIVLQVADPAVAASIACESSFLDRPYDRFRRTNGVLAAIRHGSSATREAILAHLQMVHRRVRGKDHEGTCYDATDPTQQWWVLAAVTYSSLEVARRYGNHSRPVLERYYQEQLELAAVFGIPRDALPQSVSSFYRWFEQRVNSVAPTAATRAIVETLLSPAALPFPRPLQVVAIAVTVDLLPASLAAALHLEPSLTSRAIVKLARGVSRQVPAVVQVALRLAQKRFEAKAMGAVYR